MEKKLNGYFPSHIMFVMIADIQLKDGAEEDFKNRLEMNPGKLHYTFFDSANQLLKSSSAPSLS